MDEQRTRARFGAGRGRVDPSVREHALALAGSAGFATDFVGYETTDQETTVGVIEREDGRVLVKLLESPFYATGGGQVADQGWIECADGDCLARVEDVLRVGDDQVLALVAERGEPRAGERVHAHVDRRARHATECNHTATHLLHAALRSRLGTHVHQSGSYVGPDKLRFDFSHGQALSAEELADVEEMVNHWVLENQPVRALTTTLDEAKRLGAMALFGEKYGDVVRMVEIGDGSFSRELCGGTHVRFTSQIGLFKVLSETSSAANVRRIEAITGPEGVELMRRHDRALSRAGELLRVPPEAVPDAISEQRARVKELEKAARRSGANGGVDLDALAQQASHRDGAHWLATVIEVGEAKALLEVADKLRARLGDAAVVLGRADADHVDLVANVAPALVQRGVKANEILAEAAKLVGGGGGGRDTVARAGGRDPAKLPDAIAAAQAAIEAALGG
jgi:alanyl-tRNA synthetase